MLWQCCILSLCASAAQNDNNISPDLNWSVPMQIASAPLRNNLPPNFDAAVDQFEAWCRHLLLSAFQQLGFFCDAGASQTKASIMQKVSCHGRL